MTRRFLVQVRVSDEEKARMESLASGAGVKLSEWMRSQALAGEPPRVPVEPQIDTEHLKRKVEAQMEQAPQKPSLADVPGLKRGSEVKARSKAFVCPVASCQWVGSDTSDGFCPVHGRELMARRS